MLRALGKLELVGMGYKKLGLRNGKTVYKRIVPQFDINDGMAFFHNGTRNRQITEFAYLDDATDKVVQTATRRVGEYGNFAEATSRSTKTEFTRNIIDGNQSRRTFAHYTSSEPFRYSMIKGKLPGTIHVSESHFPTTRTEVGRRTDFVFFNTNGEILSRGRVRVPQLAEGSTDGMKQVWLYNRGMGYKPKHIQSKYVSHEVNPQGAYGRALEGSGVIYTPEAKVGIPKYTSLTDLKANDEFYIGALNT